MADPGDGVCDETECTLREAIEAAASGDEIGFATGLQGDIKLADGALLINKSLTIDGAGRITVDAQRGSNVIFVGADLVTLAGLTLVNGLQSGSSGGGIAASGGVLTLDNVTLSRNEATSGGGGIAAAISAEVTIRNSRISDNVAEVGGGVSVGQGTSLTLINSTVDGNRAGDNGGGLFNEGTLAVIGSTISGNEAEENGGGVSNKVGASATVVRSTISGNHTREIVAGILNLGDMDVRSSTITRNGGMGLEGSVETTVANSVIAGNEDDDCYGGVVSLGHNLVGDCALSAPGDVQVASAQVFTEVLEQELKDNGGPTKTHALIPRGRAVDAGYCPGETADQRGFPRPVDDPVMTNALDACDIGAYELQGPVATVADLMISQTVNKTSVKQGELLTYSIRVQNLGPESAPNVVVTDILPTGATFVEARHNKGSHTAPPRGETGTVTWSVGEMLDQANEVAEITVTVLVKGKTTITNTASVTGDVADPNEANNSAAIKVSVASGTGGKGGGKK